MSSWRKPINGFYKVNVNGVSNWPHGKAAVGCILRNDDGEVYRASGGMLGMSDPEFAGLWAIYYGLVLAWEKEKTTVTLETDDGELLRRVMNPDPEDSCMYLIDMIVRIMDEDWDNLELKAIPPSANGAAELADYFLDGEGGVDEIRILPRSVKAIVDREMGG